MLDLANMAMTPSMALRGEELYLGGLSNTNGAGHGTSYHEFMWVPPRGALWALMFVWGGGAGGGGGKSGASGTARGGGGGGAAGNLWKGLFWLPAFGDGAWALVLRPGHGGNGGAADTGGFNGAMTSVHWDRTGGTNGVSGLVICNHTSAASSGNPGTGAAGGGGGIAASLPNQQMNHCFFGLMQPGSNSGWINGNNGSSGGAQTGAVGSSVTFPGGAAQTLLAPFSGGAGGAGVGTGDVAFAGGNQSAFGALFPQLNGGAAGSNNGSGGQLFPRPLFGGRGGCGGGSNGTGVGGNGGAGAPGCGGGGGGGGTTGGRGGPGGPGGVLILYG